MLFDLRGRGRRTTVRVVYIGLAVLLGGSLIFLGVGTGFGGGGFLNAVGENEGSSGASFANQIKKYEKQTKQQPRNVRAWENLTNAQLHEASGEGYVSKSGGLTSKGKELYAQAARSWSTYLALNPRSPNPTLAQQMVRIYGEEGLNQPAEAVKVLQIVTAARPESSALLAELAEYAYRAHNVSVGDLASQKAVTLAPAVQRARLKTVLAELKKHPNPNEALTATGPGGKTYSVKRGAKGNYTSTGPAPTPTTPNAPAGQLTTPTK
jgi:hypothetical protein